MRFRYLLLGLLALALVGCEDPLFESTLSISEDTGTGSFELPATQSTYDITVQVEYHPPREYPATVTAVLTLPNETTLTDARELMKPEDRLDKTIRTRWLRFHDVEQQEGTYSVTITGDPDTVRFKSAKAMIYAAE